LPLKRCPWVHADDCIVCLKSRLWSYKHHAIKLGLWMIKMALVQNATTDAEKIDAGQIFKF
jgi:hypothetical protein